MAPRPHLVAAAAATLLAALTAAVALRGGEPFGVDSALHRWSLDHRDAGTDRVLLDLTRTGFGVGPFVLAAAAGALTAAGTAADPRRRRSRLLLGALLGAVVLLAAWLLRIGLAQLLGRDRPPSGQMVYSVAGPALPSGHASLSAIAAIALSVALLRRHGWRAARLTAVAVLALWVVAVGASRVYLGVHWATDVLAGWLYAVAFTALLLPVCHRALTRTAAAGPAAQAP